MPRLLMIEHYNNFKEVRDFSPHSINAQVLKTVASLDEREQLEAYILGCLSAVT